MLDQAPAGQDEVVVAIDDAFEAVRDEHERPLPLQRSQRLEHEPFVVGIERGHITNVGPSGADMTPANPIPAAAN